MDDEMIIEWSEEKDKLLKKERGISFNEVAAMIRDGMILDDIKHPSVDKYPNQKMYILNINGYACIVPFVRGDGKIFLKTIIFSRKYTKIYLK
jgi:uncharacterized DUF497 family protein